MFALRRSLTILTATASLTAAAPQRPHRPQPPDLSKIQTVVVIYAENRGFDTLFGSFPGANGLRGLPRSRSVQRDRDGSVLKTLPPIWTGLTAQGVTPAITEAQTDRLPNAPFAIDAPKGFKAARAVPTRRLV